MNHVKLPVLILSLLLASCTSTTLIESVPSGAKLYINEEPVGTTPYTYSDTKIMFTSSFVRLEKEGYEPLTTTFTRDEEVDVGAIIGGIFFYVPFLWTMGYKPVHTYELVPYQGPEINAEYDQQDVMNQSQADQIRDLKKLLDENIITQEEFEMGKKKILEGN